MRYCSFCGLLLKESLVGAETYKCQAEQCTWDLASKFDRDTGQRNYVTKYICPSWRHTWYRWLVHDDHDNYLDDKVVNLPTSLELGI